jgi:anti-sigma B factor antagonist
VDLFTASVTAAESRGTAYTLLTLAGEIDVTNSDELRGMLETAVSEGARTLVVDLSGVSFMDSSALHALLQVTRMLHRQQGVLSVVSPQGVVDRLLRLCAADQLMPIYSSVPEAIGG